MNYLTKIERGGLPHRNELHYDPSVGSDSGEPGADGPFRRNRDGQDIGTDGRIPIERLTGRPIRHRTLVSQ